MPTRTTFKTETVISIINNLLPILHETLTHNGKEDPIALCKAILTGDATRLNQGANYQCVNGQIDWIQSDTTALQKLSTLYQNPHLLHQSCIMKYAASKKGLSDETNDNLRLILKETVLVMLLQTKKIKTEEASFYQIHIKNTFPVASTPELLLGLVLFPPAFLAATAAYMADTTVYIASWIIPIITVLKLATHPAKIGFGQAASKTGQIVQGSLWSAIGYHHADSLLVVCAEQISKYLPKQVDSKDTDDDWALVVTTI